MVGKPQKLSKGQEEHVIHILRNKLLAWVLISFAILAGITGASLWGIMKRAETTMEKMVKKQFEESRIHKVVRTVAAEHASRLMSKQISPEVEQFKTDIADELSEVQQLVEKTRKLEAEGQKHKASIVGIASNIEHIATRTGLAESRLETVETNLTLVSTNIDLLNKDLAKFNKRFKDITGEQEFLSVANRARLFSLDAFKQLQALSKSSSAYAADAKQIVWALRRRMEIDRDQHGEYLPNESYGDYVYRGPFTSQEIAIRLLSRESVEGASNLARKEKLTAFVPQLVKMAKDEQPYGIGSDLDKALSMKS